MGTEELTMFTRLTDAIERWLTSDEAGNHLAVIVWALIAFTVLYVATHAVGLGA